MKSQSDVETLCNEIVHYPGNWNKTSTAGVIPTQIFYDKQGLVQGYCGLA